MVKYLATIKLWRDKINGNTYFSAQILNLKKDITQYIEWQYGGTSTAEQECKELLGVKNRLNSELPIKFIVIPNCLKRDMITWGENHT